jgi:hypothetical protein
MATRYQLGDVLLPEAESLAIAIPKLIAQSKVNQLNERRLNQESRRIGIDESRAEEALAFRNQQARISQQNHLQQLAFQKSQAEERTMNSMLSAAKTPSQQAMIYNQYGKYEMAAEVEAEGNKVEDQNTIVKNYWSESLGSSYKDAVIAGKGALSNIDITHPNYSSIAERTDEAYRESLNPYQDMMKDPAYKLQADILLAKGKMPNADIQGIFDQLDSMKERYKKERYGESYDEDGEGKTLEEQSNELVSGLITGDAFTPKGALSFLPDEEIQVAKEKAEPLKKQHGVLSSRLTALKSQRQSAYDNYEAKKKDLSVAIKQVKYYAKIKDKAKLKKANDSYRKLQSEVNTLKSEVSKLKLGEQTGGAPSKSDKSLGAQISRLNLEINSLNRQGRRLTGQPVYGGGYYNR